MVKVSLKKSGNTNVFYKKSSQVSYKQYNLDERINRPALLKVLDSFKNRLQDGHIYKFAGFLIQLVTEMVHFLQKQILIN